MFNITTAVFGSHHLLLHVFPVNFFFFLENRAVYEIMWKKIVHADGPHITT